MRIGEHDTHPAANAYGLMFGHELAGLVDDIKVNGLRLPIALTEDGRILDGRNRYLACLAAKVQPRFETITGDPWLYVVSLNHTRRHMDGGDRAVSARRLEQAARRERAQPRLPKVDPADAQRVDDLLDGGEPELIAARDAGLVTLADAAVLSRLEPDRQREAVERVKVEAEKPRPPKRDKAEKVEPLGSVVVMLDPVDVVALRSLMFLGERSQHAEARAGAALLRRIIPCVGR